MRFFFVCAKTAAKAQVALHRVLPCAPSPFSITRNPASPGPSSGRKYSSKKHLQGLGPLRDFVGTQRSVIPLGVITPQQDLTWRSLRSNETCHSHYPSSQLELLERHFSAAIEHICEPGSRSRRRTGSFAGCTVYSCFPCAAALRAT